MYKSFKNNKHKMFLKFPFFCLYFRCITFLGHNIISQRMPSDFLCHIVAYNLIQFLVLSWSTGR